MYRITNKSNDVRKFKDGNSGKYIFVIPNQIVFNKNPPIKSNIWKIEKVKENNNTDERRDTSKMKTKKIEKVSNVKHDSNIS